VPNIQNLEGSNPDLVEAYQKLAAHLVLLAPDGSNLRRRFSQQIARFFGALLPRVYISYAREDGTELADDVRKCINDAGIAVWEDVSLHQGSHEARQRSIGILNQVEFLVAVITSDAAHSQRLWYQWRQAARRLHLSHQTRRSLSPAGRVARLDAGVAFFRY
jgi:hypothetical protein